jgi:hypothetical protein
MDQPERDLTREGKRSVKGVTPEVMPSEPSRAVRLDDAFDWIGEEPGIS